MRSFGFVVSILAVMGLAFWAYGENYKTQRALKDLSQLQRELAALRDARAVLRAEWAYLNRPDRLRDLASLNFHRLRLVPLQPAQFGRIEQIAFPKPEIVDPIDVVGLLPPIAEDLP